MGEEKFKYAVVDCGNHGLGNEEIFVQARAEPNDCVKPNEQNRVYSNFSMASNRTFKNLFGLCRAQPNFRASECNRACSYCRA